MKLADKIDEIRKKPEHIRMRYVWACTIISLFLIIILWIFSLTGGRISNSNSNVNLPSSEIMQQFQNQKQSMEDYKNQLNNMQNSLENAQDQQDSQNQAQNQSGTSNSQPDTNSEIAPSPQDNPVQNNSGN